MARFVCVRPEGKEGRFSLMFLLSFMALSSIVIIVSRSITYTLLGVGASVIVSYVIFGEGRVESGRTLRFRISDRFKSSNFEDEKYIGDTFFDFPNIRPILENSENQNHKNDGLNY